MANIQRRKNADRTTSYVALVRVRGFDAASKSFPDREAAEEWAEALERELREQRSRGGLRRDTTQLTVTDLIREYTADPVNSARKSADDATALLDWWRDHYGSIRLRELNVLTLRAARDQLRDSGERVRVAEDGTRTVMKRAAATVNRHVSQMRAAWNWGRKAGLIAGNQLWPTGLMLAEPRARARFLSDPELTRLMKAAEAAGPVVRAAIVLSITTGLRQGELLRLRWVDIDTDRATLRVMESKTDEPRAVFLPPPAVAALKALRARPVVGVFVFVFDDGTRLDKSLLTSRWKSVRTAAGLSNARWHDMRHCVASYLLQAGASLAEVGSVLGHRNAVTTQRYAHLVAGKELPAHAALAQKLAKAMKAGQGGESKA